MLRRIAKLTEKFFPPKKSFVKEYSLKTILEDISSILKNNCGKLTMFSGYDMTVEEIWGCVQFDGANKGLNKELKVHKKSCFPTRLRKTPLENQTIKGNYLFFHYWEKQVELYNIYSYNNRNELINSITDALFDPFLNGFIIPIVNGRVIDISFAVDIGRNVKYGRHIGIEAYKETYKEKRGEIEAKLNLLIE